MTSRREPADITLATTRDGRCVWSANDSSCVAIHWTSLCPPNANAGVDIGLAVAGERFMQSLPLWQFLRELTPGQRHIDPPLGAAFMIDDPDSHWPHYGFADCRDIAADALRGHHQDLRDGLEILRGFAHAINSMRWAKCAGATSAISAA